MIKTKIEVALNKDFKPQGGQRYIPLKHYYLAFIIVS
jgi:hypothetical protein